MIQRHPSRRSAPLALPRCWLFSDERLETDVALLAALLPPGSGIVVRHDGMPRGARWRLVRRLVRIARSRGLTILLAAPPDVARRWGADGVHLRQYQARDAARACKMGLPVTLPVHDAAEARRARRVGAQAAFISPLHPTRSHPGAPALGTAAWLRLARIAGAQPVALGGMTAARARRLSHAAMGSDILPGWAAIDAWQEKAAKRLARQKRNCVPT
jgi:thiamine-phosphate pyrophosphorylase